MTDPAEEVHARGWSASQSYPFEMLGPRPFRRALSDVRLCFLDWQRQPDFGMDAEVDELVDLCLSIISQMRVAELVGRFSRLHTEVRCWSMP
jgi:hypothetical protein